MISIFHPGQHLEASAGCLTNWCSGQVLGSDVSQQGSQVATDRLRFDFNAPNALKPAQLERVETLVNEWIQAGDALTTSTMGLEEAKAAGKPIPLPRKLLQVLSSPRIIKQMFQRSNDHQLPGQSASDVLIRCQRLRIPSKGPLPAFQGGLAPCRGGNLEQKEKNREGN